MLTLAMLNCFWLFFSSVKYAKTSVFLHSQRRYSCIIRNMTFPIYSVIKTRCKATPWSEIRYTRCNNLIVHGHIRATHQISNAITAVKILAGSSDMCFFITNEPIYPMCLVKFVLLLFVYMIHGRIWQIGRIFYKLW